MADLEEADAFDLRMQLIRLVGEMEDTRSIKEVVEFMLNHHSLGGDLFGCLIDELADVRFDGIIRWLYLIFRPVWERKSRLFM